MYLGFEIKTLKMLLTVSIFNKVILKISKFFLILGFFWRKESKLFADSLKINYKPKFSGLREVIFFFSNENVTRSML